MNKNYRKKRQPTDLRHAGFTRYGLSMFKIFKKLINVIEDKIVTYYF